MSRSETHLSLEYSLESRSRVVIRPGSSAALADWLPADVKDRLLFVVTDDQVARLYAQSIVDPLRTLAGEVVLQVVPAGEPSKSPAGLQACWEGMAAAGMTRDALMIAVGGGVVGDLAGFAAATYGRGISWLQIPTTLMAQVDSSLGGKVGINLAAGKNLVGCVWQPEQVLIDPRLLRTLPWREFQSGLAEVVKYAVIWGEPFRSQLCDAVSALRERNEDILSAVIGECCRCKLRLVQADPLDRLGARALLNYGHTFGHAIEQTAGYGTWTHGEAVACGMSLAARLARRLRWVPDEFVQQQDDLLQAFELPVRGPTLPVDDLLRAMAHDKKSQRGRLRFVLPRGWGDLALTDAATVADVEQVLRTGE